MVCNASGVGIDGMVQKTEVFEFLRFFISIYAVDSKNLPKTIHEVYDAAASSRLNPQR